MSRILGDVFQILNGNVGLGTTLPRQRFDLYEGNALFGGNAVVNGNAVFGGNVGIGTNDPLNYRLFVENGTSYLNKVVTSNLVLLQEPTAYFQITPIRKVYYIETASESVFNVDVIGIYGGVASNIQCFVNNNLLNYYSPSIKEYEVSYTHHIASNLTTYTITLSTPAINGSFVDITVVPQIITQTDLSNNLFSQNINVTDTYFRPYGNNIAYTYGNVGIGTTDTAAGKLVVNGTIVTNNNNVNVGTGTVIASTFSGTATQVSQDLVRGFYLTGTNYNGSVSTEWGVDATTTAIANKIVARDAFGDVFANNIEVGNIYYTSNVYQNDRLQTSFNTTTYQTVIGWGGTNSYGERTIPTVASNIIAVSTGYDFSLALNSDGNIIGWGNNGNNQINIPNDASTYLAISAGYIHSLAVKSDGSVIGWGDNSLGQITIPDTASNCIAVAAGFYHSLALKSDGSVIGWGGTNIYGEVTIPESASNCIAIAAGSFYSLALKNDGSVIGWGNVTIPNTASNCIAISAGGDLMGPGHSLALKSDGSVIGWGLNNFGQSTIPEFASNCSAIAAGLYYSVALKKDGTVVAWGTNGTGQLTIPDTASNCIAIAAAPMSSHILVLKNDYYAYVSKSYSIGIGTTLPKAMLDVNGTVIVSGNVGIGTLTPTALLHVQGGNAIVSGTLTSSSTVQGTRLISTVAAGTAPLTVASTTVVTNLNADLVDGLNASQFMRSDANTSTSGTLTGTRLISTVAAGTAPLTVASTTLVNNLNAQYLNGQPASYYTNYANLTGLPIIPAAQIQSDWNQTNTAAADFIKNKPSVVTSGSSPTLTGATVNGEINTNTTIRINNSSPTICFQDTNHNTGFIHVNSDLMYILRGADNATSWTQVSGRWPWQFNLTNNNSTCGGSLTVLDATLNPSGSAPLYPARAWVRFTSTGARTGNGNVSSVTKRATGRFTITFTTAMPVSSYAVSGSSHLGGAADSSSDNQSLGPWGFTTADFELQITDGTNNTFQDPSYCSATVYC